MVWREIVIAATLCCAYLRGACLKQESMKHAVIFPRILEAMQSDDELAILLADGLTLNLKRYPAFSETVLRITTGGEYNLKEYLKGSDLNRHIYQDKNHLSAVSVTIEDGVVVEGIINGSLRIKPLLLQERSEDGRIPHEFFEDKGFMGHSNYASGDHMNFIVEPRSMDVNGGDYLSSSSPKTAVVELMVMVSPYYVTESRNKSDVETYIGVSTTAVNMMFKQMTSPELLIRICSVVFLDGSQESTIYSKVKVNEVTSIDVMKTLRKLKKYIKDNKYSEPDLVYFFTPYSMVFKTADEQYRENIRGMAYVQQACLEEKVGIVQDTYLSYSSFRFFAHELGHSLGCLHDGDRYQENFPERLRNQECPFAAGFLMGDLDSGSNWHNFSNCSLQVMTYTTMLKTHSCLFEKNCENYIHRSKLPREEQSRNESCKEACQDGLDWYFDVPIGENKIKTCILRCRTPPYFPNGSQSGTYYLCEGAARDGLRCGDEKVCWNKTCVTKHIRYSAVTLV